MNYIELINDFWRRNKEEAYSTTEIAVYFYLVSVANELQWKNPFYHGNIRICAELSISEPTLHRARQKLVEGGLINFLSGQKKREFTQYSILGINNITLTDSLSVTLTDSLSRDKGIALVKEILPQVLDKDKLYTKLNNIPPNPQGGNEPEIKDLTDAQKADWVISALNKISGRDFKKTDFNRKHIIARLKEKYTGTDFVTVINDKVREWKDTEMAKFIRPQTLFGTKFESYLQSIKTIASPKLMSQQYTRDELNCMD